ncbi:MAG: hypothetical protein K2K31_03375, partial [Clostridia bacterium]|nr:hypothetical protein [Clostridia bacterium]
RAGRGGRGGYGGNGGNAVYSKLNQTVDGGNGGNVGADAENGNGTKDLSFRENVKIANRNGNTGMGTFGLFSKNSEGKAQYTLASGVDSNRNSDFKSKLEATNYTLVNARGEAPHEWAQHSGSIRRNGLQVKHSGDMYTSNDFNAKVAGGAVAETIGYYSIDKISAFCDLGDITWHGTHNAWAADRVENLNLRGQLAELLTVSKRDDATGFGSKLVNDCRNKYNVDIDFFVTRKIIFEWNGTQNTEFGDWSLNQNKTVHSYATMLWTSGEYVNKATNAMCVNCGTVTLTQAQ